MRLSLRALLAPPSSRTGSRLLPCPDKPNCVSTDSSEAAGRRMAPIAFTDAPANAHQRILAALRAEPRTEIVEDRPDYVRAEVTSRIFRFRDDVEILLDRASRLIHFRSASRIGHGDLGVNRARMERIQARLRM